MAYWINDECINCGSCEYECSFGSISEGTGKRLIDPDRCRECTACAQICPVFAIQPATELSYFLVNVADPGFTIH